MNFFVFDTERSRISLSKDFWKYWVVVLPITLSLVLGGSYYTLRNHSKGNDDDVTDSDSSTSNGWVNNTIPSGPFLNPYAWFNLPYRGETHTNSSLEEQPRIHTQDSFFT